MNRRLLTLAGLAVLIIGPAFESWVARSHAEPPPQRLMADPGLPKTPPLIQLFQAPGGWHALCKDGSIWVMAYDHSRDPAVPQWIRAQDFPQP